MNYKTTKYDLCIIGAFPPPIHGLAKINKAMTDEFIKSGLKPVIFNLNTKTLNRSIFNIFYRLIKVLIIIPRYLYQITMNRIEYLYIGLSGGFGQIYDLIFILIGTLLKRKIYIHHHSFAYLNRTSILFQLIVFISQKSAEHIVLCNTMKERLLKYNNTIHIRVLSNAVFLGPPELKNIKDKETLLTVGFLGNISIEKGIKYFFNTLNKLNHSRTINGIIGGPFQDKISEVYTRNELKKHPYISYVGSVYANEKEKFFKSIDLLLMPSILEEAEPLVIHESMSYGVPVIAYDKGCISEIISDKSGLVINSNLNFVKGANEQIINWIKHPNSFQKTRNFALKSFINNKINSKYTLEKLLIDITNKQST